MKLKKYLVGISTLLLIFGTTLTSCDLLQEEPDSESTDNNDKEDKTDDNLNDDDPGYDPTVPDKRGFVAGRDLYAYFPLNGNLDEISGNDVYGYGAPEPTYSSGLTSGTKSAQFSRSAKTKFVVGEGLIDSRAMSICFWVKDLGDGTIFYVTSASKNDGGEEMMSFAYVDGHLKYVISRYNNHYQYSKTGNFTHKSLEDADWHHIALVSDYNRSKYSAATTLLYIDGRVMDTVTEDINIFGEAESNPHYNSGTKFILGGDNVPNMKIANLRVYNTKTLTASEVKAIFNAKQ